MRGTMAARRCKQGKQQRVHNRYGAGTQGRRLVPHPGLHPLLGLEDAGAGLLTGTLGKGGKQEGGNTQMWGIRWRHGRGCAGARKGARTFTPSITSSGVTCSLSTNRRICSPPHEPHQARVDGSGRRARRPKTTTHQDVQGGDRTQPSTYGADNNAFETGHNPKRPATPNLLRPSNGNGPPQVRCRELWLGERVT